MRAPQGLTVAVGQILEHRKALLERVAHVADVDLEDGPGAVVGRIKRVLYRHQVVARPLLVGPPARPGTAPDRPGSSRSQP